MKKPSKPTPPREPSAPTRTYDDTWAGSLSICGSISSILRQIERQLTHWRTVQPTYVFADPTLDDLVIELEHDGYGGDDHIEVKWAQKVTITMTESEWAAAQTKYLSAKDAYETKLAVYQVKIDQYDRDLDAYEAERVCANEAREQETLARLYAKYRTVKP